MKRITAIVLFSIVFFARSVYSAPGDLDTSFGTGGRVTTIVQGIGELPGKMVLQPDGKILMTGNSFNGFSVDMIVSRFNTNGQADLTFGSGGSARIAFGDLLAAGTDIALQNDGKIVVVGLASAGFGSDINFAVARLNANGTPDTSFDGDGKLTTSFDGNLLEAAFGVAIQTDGKIIAAGSRQNGTTGESWFAIARYNANGTLDTTFDSDGKLFFKAAATNDVVSLGQDVALQADGKIVMAGELNNGAGGDFALVRLNSDGGFDNSFDSDGRVRTAITVDDDAAYTVEIAPDGRILVAGFADTDLVGTGNYDFAVARYLTNGALDTSFAGTGKTTIAFGEMYDTEQVYDIALTPGGDIYLAGQSGVAGEPVSSSDFAFVRLLLNGSIDSSFGTAGKVRTNFTGTFSVAYGAAVQADGKLVVGGATGDTDGDTQESSFALARYIGGGGGVPPRVRFDFTGDGRADVSVFRPSEGNWYIYDSNNGNVTSAHFGQPGDMPAPGDFDGDGKHDISVFRPSDGNWYRLNSSDGTFAAVHFGTSGDLPAVGNFDGDSRADISLFRPSEGNWYRLNSMTGTFVGLHFGLSGDKPAVGDYDGDGFSDISVFRPSEGNWYRINSSNSQVVGVHFGVAEDMPVQADYDGDGKDDISVFRPSEGTWYRLNSLNGGFFGMHFGATGDKPVAADYDGDGKADIGVFRPSEGNWYIMKSTTGFFAQHFGTVGDAPTPSSFVY